MLNIQTDMTGIPARTIAGLEALGQAGVAVALVTGRCAGWAQALAGYLPAVRVAVAIQRAGGAGVGATLSCHGAATSRKRS